METTRRNFIKTAGLSILGSGIWPAFQQPLHLAHQSLPRRSPESQGVDSAGIRAFLDAVLR